MSGDPLAGLDPCVHCGFCLQACPTYVATGDEADSPRGRIVLMQGIRRGTLSPEADDLLHHLDRCLGCRACESACPSGVQYGHALEAVRAEIGRTRPLPLLATVVLQVMGDRRLHRPLFALSRLARPVAALFAGRSRGRFLLGMLAATRMGVGVTRRAPGRSPGVAGSPPSSEAVVFRGCVMDGLFGHVNAATGRTLAVNGYRLAEVSGQACCGALHLHAGLEDEARDLARANVRAFADAPEATVVVNSAGCGAALKDYARLLADDPLADAAARFAGRVMDISEVLAARGPAQGARLDLTVSYDAPCHLQHAQQVTDPPLRLLEAIPGLRRVQHAESDQCCGSAGLYGLLQPELSGKILDRKLAAIAAVAPDVLVTGNPGCAMQLGAGLLAAGHRTAVMHPVELLDLSYRAGRADTGAPGSRS